MTSARLRQDQRGVGSAHTRARWSPGRGKASVILGRFARARSGASQTLGQSLARLAARVAIGVMLELAALDALHAQIPQASEPLGADKPASMVSQHAGSGYGSGGYLVQLIGGLAFVVIAILAFGWFMRRFSGASSVGIPRAIEILAVRSVGTRERLILVQVGEEQVLIGVSPAGMRALHRLEKPLKPPIPSTSDNPAKKAGVDFASLLRKQMSRSTDA